MITCRWVHWLYAAALVAAAPATAQRVRCSLDPGWRFTPGDPAETVGTAAQVVTVELDRGVNTLAVRVDNWALSSRARAVPRR